MGALDLPAPLLSWIDIQLARAAPDIARVLVWAAIAAALSMTIYWLLSPQRRLARIAAAEKLLRDRLNAATDDLSDGLASAGRLLRLALQRLGLVLLPACVAALPVVCIMAWLHTHYSYEMPADNAVAVTVEPESATGRVVTDAGAPARIEVRDGRGALLQSVTLGAAVPVIHKRLWWNTLIGNPLGYLPEDAAIERIDIALPEKQYLSIGPDWLRTWQASFIGALLAASILIKFLFRIR